MDMKLHGNMVQFEMPQAFLLYVDAVRFPF